MKETREMAEGFVLRRTRSCPCGARFSTYEVDESLKGTVVKLASRRDRIAVRERKIAVYWRNVQIVRRAARERVSDIAAAFSLSPNMVSTILRKFKGEKQQ